MLADEAAVPNTSVTMSKLAVFLNQGIDIQDAQYVIDFNRDDGANPCL